MVTCEAPSRCETASKMRRALCKWLGHRWLYDGWWKIDDGWLRHHTCKRCGSEQSFKTNTQMKPLDVIEPTWREVRRILRDRP